MVDLTNNLYLLFRALQGANSDKVEISEPFYMHLSDNANDEDYVPVLEFLEERIKKQPTVLEGLDFYGVEGKVLMQILARILSHENCLYKSNNISFLSVPFLDVFLANCKPVKGVTRYTLGRAEVHGESLANMLKEPETLEFLQLLEIQFPNEITLQKCGEFLASKKMTEVNCDNTSLMPFIAKNQNIKNITLPSNFENATQFILQNSSSLKNFHLLLPKPESQSAASDFFKFFSKNTSLTKFSLACWETVHIESFGGGFQGNTSLKILDIKATSECVHELLDGTNGISELRVFLPQSYNHDIICDFVEKTTTIQSIQLMSPHGFSQNTHNGTKLFSGLFKNSSIKKFMLDIGIAIDSECNNIIARIFNEKPEKLQVFTCLNSEISPSFFDCLPNNTTLQNLAVNVGKCKKLDPYQSSLETFLRRSSTIRTLKIFGIVKEVNAKSLFFSLICNESITELHLLDNYLYDEVCKCFTEKNKGRFVIFYFYFKRTAKFP
jgi:hypothetical protein